MNISRGILVAIAATAAVALTTAFADTAPICGDVNDNGSVTTADALLVLRKAVSLPTNLICAAGTAGSLLKTGQTKSYGPGDDGDVQAGLALAYEDNADGTITDVNTGLMWEKKVGSGERVQCTTESNTCANPHMVNNVYSWSSNGNNNAVYNGAVKTIFLDQLNNRCNKNTKVKCTKDADCSGSGGPCGFAGHRDWRLPNKRELESILNVGRIRPEVDPAFNGAGCNSGCLNITSPTCSCTAWGPHWSSTSDVDATYNNAWTVDFYEGGSSVHTKTVGASVRAVRGGF